MQINYGVNHPSSAISGIPHRYGFNGKEEQMELGLGWLDFGARNYDATLGRWMNPDPLADLRYELTPYNYVQNSPMFKIDPDGLTDYTLNKKTGAVTQVGEANDEPDRILQTYTRKSKRGEVKYKKNGEAKVAIGGIEKGILSDGQNFKTDDTVIETGGEGQASVDGVKSFTLQLSEYVGKELKGFSYSSDGSGDVSDIVLGKYNNNDRTKSSASVIGLVKKYGLDGYSDNNIVQQFHTHPDGKLGATQSAPGQSQDIKNLQNAKPKISNATFIILYRINGQKKPAEYDYTHEYRPKK
ncbi:RHS repeat-associated core domain-containing protein [Aquimarina sp. W85]|uniref:RHS repeat-associated core domain-containing protein n=1 Tax=Aquimarina rhodophyticola TaxID=3342246 RepID=UPI0036703B3B